MTASTLLRKLLRAPEPGAGADRGRERLRRVLLTVVASLLARASTMIVLLITVPMALAHLGPERFGMWMVISSFAALMVFADFGLGNGVLNLVASASGADDDKAIKIVASSGLVGLSCAGAILAGAILSSYSFVPWEAVFNVSSPLAVSEAGPAILIFVLCIAVGLPAGLGAKVQFGLQQGYAANLWTAIGGLLSLAGLVLAIRLGAGVPVMVLALFGGQQLALLCNYLLFFHRDRTDLTPKLGLATATQIRALLGLSVFFFLLQLIAAIAFRADALIVGQFFGPDQAGVYAIYERLFSFVTMVVTIAVAPLWPAYGEAIERGDHDWMTRILRQSTLLSIGITAAASLTLAFSSGLVIDLWIGRPLAVPMALIAGFAVWKVIEAGGASIAVFLNGAGAIRIQLVLAAGMCASGLALKLLFAQQLGLASIVWFTIATYTLWLVIPMLFVLPHLIRRLSERGTGRSGAAAETP